MAHIIAVIWDFDRTLIDGYMQDPIFNYYNVDSKQFWKEVNDLPKFYKETQNVKVNHDTIYLNHFIKYAKEGIFKDLNNAKLYDFGKELKFYPGVPDIFESTRKIIEENEQYKDYDIKLEHYVVSTGMSQVIRGSIVYPYIEDLWGCELIENNNIISEIGYTIDHTSKTRALFEINKGANKRNDINANTKIPLNLRRVPFENMIYIADGPSDIPAFSVINQYGGSTLAVYPKGNMQAFKQVEQLSKDGRVNLFTEANYEDGTQASMWLQHQIMRIADRIVKEEMDKLNPYAIEGPKHLNS